MEEQSTAPAKQPETGAIPKKADKPAAFTPYQIFVIAVLALIQFTVILDFMILSPLGDILMKSMGISTSQFGTVVSAYALSAGLSGFLAAGFADKYDRKKLLLFFYAGFILGTLFCGLAFNFATLLLARIVTGIFGGVISSIGMAIITDIFSMQQRGRVMGFVQMAFAGSQILGIPIGLLIAAKWNWHATFFMVVALAVLIGLAVVFRLRPVNEHLKLQTQKSPFKHLAHTLEKRNYLIGFCATALLSLGGFMLMPFTTAFIVNNVHISQNDLPLIFFCTGISSIVIMPIIGRLSDRIDRVKLFTIGSVLAAVMVVIYTNLPPVHIWVVIVVNMIMFMGIMSRMVPATALNSAVPDMADRGAYMSITSSLQQVAGGLAAMFAGFVVTQQTKVSPIEHFDTLGYVMVGVMAVGILLMQKVNNVVKAKMAKAAN